MGSRLLLAAFLAFLLHAPAAVAQAPPDPATPRFTSDVVVTPERGETPRPLVPASTVVIDAASLPALPAAHASEIAAFIPGFSVMRAAWHAGRPVVSARGFFGGGEADYILLLLDGVPLSDVESGLVDWSLVPATSIRRIEAFRGPGASLYGDSAIGGVVQILTDRSGGARLNASAGSFATFAGDASLGRRFGPTGYFVSGVGRRTDGAFEHSGGRQVLVAGSADGGHGRLTYRLQASGEDRQRDDPGSLSRVAALADPQRSDPIFRFDGTDRTGFSAGATLGYDGLGFRPQMRLYVNGRDEETIRTILLAPALGDRRARALETSAVGGSVEGERHLGDGRVTLRFGLDLARERLDTAYHSVTPAGGVGALDSATSGRRVRTGAFASSSWEATTRVRFYGALRWDDVGDEGFGSVGASPPAPQRAWSPRGGVAVQLADTGMSAYVQASRAFKAPTLDQLFDPRPYPDFSGGTFTISNRQLVPQRAANVEAGISGSRGLRWSALAYRMSVDDEIDFDLRTFSYANIGRSTHAGVELEAEGQVGRRVRPAASYALARVRDGDTSLQLKNVPRHVATVGAHLDLPWGIGAYARYYRSWGAFLDDEQAFAVDGASGIDLRVRRSLRRHTLFVDVLNVANDAYEEYGFTLADFAGRAVPYVYPGTPRAIRAGATIIF